MSIVSYVEGLREKPEHIRKKASFWWALGITLVVALGWLASFEFKGSSSSQASAAAAAQSVSSPGESMAAAVGDLAGDLWSRIVGPKKVTFSEVVVTPGKN